MPGHIEVETQELQNTIQELNEEREQRKADAKHSAFLRYIGLTTAILAVFAAVGALQSGILVNEALIDQVKASDTWNQYQAARQKGHLYTLALDGLLDAHAKDSAVAAQMRRPLPPAARLTDRDPATPNTTPKTAAARAGEYRDKTYAEVTKENAAYAGVRKFEHDSAAMLRQHHFFESSVALIQVAIALGAIAALTRMKLVWYFSILCGLVGIGFFVAGFAA